MIIYVHVRHCSSDKLLKVWYVHLKFTFLKSTGPEAPIAEETLFYRLKTVMNMPLNVNATTCCRIIRLFQMLLPDSPTSQLTRVISNASIHPLLFSVGKPYYGERKTWLMSRTPLTHIPCSRYGNNKAKHKCKLVGVALGKPWGVCEDDWFYSQNAKQP